MAQDPPVGRWYPDRLLQPVRSGSARDRAEEAVHHFYCTYLASIAANPPQFDRQLLSIFEAVKMVPSRRLGL